jgi:NAD(P)H-flavin reductase
MVDKNIYVSLERNMKCGVGKCGHCQMDGLYVCQDGPVFKYADLAEVQEAIQ